jgi:diaminopimelate epimerase
VSIGFAKGHGTQNDFVLIDDPDGGFDLTPDAIRELADRRTGLGADGVIRVVRTASALPQYAGQDDVPEWFMDYWNGDGSPAEMCGNGVRVFVTHLIRRGWLDLPEGGSTVIATRGGVTPVGIRDGQVRADLGAWRVPGGPAAIAAGGDVKVTLPGNPVLPGLAVALSNPHVVVVLPDAATLAAVDLSAPPLVDPVPVDGTNVELVVPLHEPGAGVGHIRLRVHERGVGETRSCGTGAVAAALATRAWAGAGAPDVWQVDVPGGTLQVRVQGSTTDGGSSELSGPAVIVADGTLYLP